MAFTSKPVPVLFTAFTLLVLAQIAASLPLAAAESAPPKYRSVDRIKGVGKFIFGAPLKDFQSGLIQPVAPSARGTLLKVSPYGDNYLVRDLTGLTWGGIPVTGMVVTFLEGKLIDLQVVMQATKGDFYVADRAFKEKYGPSDPRSFPVETWSGDKINVTLIIVGDLVVNEKTLDDPTQAKLELFDADQWNDYMDDQNAKLQSILNKRYEANRSKVKADL